MFLRALVCLLGMISGFAPAAAPPEIDASLATTTKAPPPLPILRRVVDVQLLSQYEAELGYPVQIQGTVTYVNPGAGLATLRDSSGATFFSLPEQPDETTSSITRGTVVRIIGRTQRGSFAPTVVVVGDAPVGIEIVSRRTQPRPTHLDADDLNNPANQSRYVEVRGVVRGHAPGPLKFGEGNIAISISASGGPFEAILPATDKTAAEIDKLIGAVVTVRGIYVPIATQFHKLIGIQLLAQDWSELLIEDPGLGAFAEIPIRTVNSVLKFQPGTRLRQRVSGIVTMDDPERGFYLADRTGWLWVETPQRDPVWPGVMVQVVGFPSDKDGYPALLNAVFAVVGDTNQPQPLTVTASGAYSGIFHGAPVRMQGKVVDHLIQPDSQSVLLESDDHFYQVRLLADRIAPLPELPSVGSLVEVSGICVNEFRRGAQNQTTNTAGFHSVSFYLHVRRPSDLALIAPPPFWTGRRVVWALLLIAVALVASMAWIHALRRQVERQTLFIEDKLERETVMEERTRIARELHDTLEQELAGIQMQLDAASGNLGTAPEVAAETLDMARAMLRHSRNETRRSVWDLRSTALETGDLESAFQEVMSMLHGQNPDVKISITCRGERKRLPTQIENNILRIAQEAVNNAVEHARPKHIKIALDYQPASVTLRVSDDGAGFAPGHELSAKDGHFGLAGMRERARKIKGRITIESKPNAGTLVALTVPNAFDTASKPNKT
jgi:signal transduction histidine kinase